MAIKTDDLGGTDWIDGDILYAADNVDTINAAAGDLGEVKMFALSETGAVTKATLQGKGWAICDGTTPAAQGISSPTMTAATPDLQDKFISMSNDETSGTTGGSATMDHTHNTNLSLRNADSASDTSGGGYKINGNVSTGSATVTENRPPFYELVFFMKVR